MRVRSHVRARALAGVGCSPVPHISIQIAMAAFCFALAYGFWLAYKDPTQNRVTRFLYHYVDSTRFPLFSVKDTLLVLVVVMVAVGIGTVVMTILAA